jgi:hypothetical protein
MVFLNRQLSAEVREWATDERAVVQQSGAAMVKTTDAQGNETTQKAAVKQDAQAYVQKHTGVGGDRSGPEEAWMWSFEDGFLAPLLESGAQLVDRTTTMRLVAAGSGKAGSATDLTSVKQVEMDALKGSADMFVEILVTEAPGSAYGYEFKATAKDVKTGLIKANVSSLRWNMKKRMTKEAVVTGKGYDVVEKEAEMPPVHMVSERLSMDMMNALARTWGGGQ